MEGLGLMLAVYFEFRFYVQDATGSALGIRLLAGDNPSRVHIAQSCPYVQAPKPQRVHVCVCVSVCALKDPKPLSPLNPGPTFFQSNIKK